MSTSSTLWCTALAASRYFDEEKLRAVNVEMTRRFVNAAKRWKVGRFVHISTAFASGFVDGRIDEQLHDEPIADPTFYTESKRRAEWIVAESGVPFMILRPSIVIGDSRDGHYAGPRYGLYQLWSAFERFLLDSWQEEVHYVAPRRSVPLLHQDAFQAGFMGAWRELDDGAICHLTSQASPTVREIADLSVRSHLRPEDRPLLRSSRRRGLGHALPWRALVPTSGLHEC